MADLKAVCTSNLTYSNVENKEVSKENFNNSQNVFNLFDKDSNGILDDNEVNVFFETIDSKDGKKDGNITTQGLNKYMDSSSFDKTTAKEFVDFTNALYSLTQESNADIDLYSTIENKNLGAAVPNGLIDNATHQSYYIGDCWLLTQTQSISETSWGANMINNAIKQNAKGDYLVSFDGVGEDIKITAQELNKAVASGTYSKGDADMTLIELAVEKYLNVHADDQNEAIDKKLSLARDFANQPEKNNPYHVLSSNYSVGQTSLQYLLGKQTGKPISVKNSSVEGTLRKKAESPDSCALTCDFNIAEKDQPAYQARGIEVSHSYGLSSRIDNSGNLIAILTNPHNTANKVEISYEEFATIARQVALIEK